MADQQLTLTADEREFLITLLERVLKDKQVEEHRTRAPTYRELVLKEEDHMKGLLQKLKAT